MLMHGGKGGVGGGGKKRTACRGLNKKRLCGDSKITAGQLLQESCANHSCVACIGAQCQSGGQGGGSLS